jgi:serine phosphatase RsbU (regulator of sigma subunit)
MINTATKRVRYARAGHCPVLYFHSETNCSEYFKDKGIALGMVRNKSYRNFIQAYEFEYKPGDVMVLYTDGITEGKNEKGEEFGYERLTATIQQLADQSPKEIQERIINELYEFSGTKNIDDDYTTMIIKFK